MISTAVYNFQSKLVWFIRKQMVHTIVHNKLQQLERQLHFESDSTAELQMGLWMTLPIFNNLHNLSASKEMWEFLMQLLD